MIIKNKGQKWNENCSRSIFVIFLKDLSGKDVLTRRPALAGFLNPEIETPAF